MAEIEEPDRVAEIFKGRTVLITGGSGFLGRALIEKLLRCCTELKCLYLLLMNNTEGTGEELDNLLDDVIFDSLKQQQPNAIKKCKAITGDISQDHLNISDKWREILAEEVEFIYHAAANTRFDKTISDTAQTNVEGTRNMLDFAKSCKNLQVFIHVSSAFAFPGEQIVYEKFYKHSREHFSFDQSYDKIANKFLWESPRTYGITKALSEFLVTKSMDELPIIIVRPTIVLTTLEQPIPGWCNNLYNLSGIFAGIGSGVIRSMHVDEDNLVNFVPVDIAVNLILLYTWNFLCFDRTARVANITTKPIFTWGEFIKSGEKVTTNHIPLNQIVWYPRAFLTKSKTLFIIYFYLFQIIPALLIDAILIMLGSKPQLYRAQTTVRTLGEGLSFFATRPWNFENNQLVAVGKRMNSRENRIYKSEITDFHMENYVINCLLNIKRHILKESDEMIPKAKRNIARMWLLDIILRFALVSVLVYSIHRTLF